MVDARIQTEIQVLVHDLPRHVANGRIADSGVVLALRLGEAVRRESERPSVLEKEVLLLEAEPRIRIVEDGCPRVGGVGSSVGMHDLVQDQHSVSDRGVGINRHRLEHAVGAVALRLSGRAAVESPVRDRFQRGDGVKVLDQGLAAEVGDWLVTVEPHVFQFVFRHGVFNAVSASLGLVVLF